MTSFARIFLCIAGLLVTASLAAAGLKSEAIAADRLYRALNSDTPPRVVDIRSPDEFSSGHIAGAESIPVPLLARHLGELKQSGNLVLYCNDSRLTRMAEQILMKKNFTGFRHLDGGMNAWMDGELPIETSLD